MRILLDTHAFLWFALNDSRLSKARLSLIENTRNEILLSTASLWEMAIKSGLGKLRLDAPYTEFLELNVVREKITIVQPSFQHFATVQKLPQHHRDPFDRLIIAQSMVEQIPVMTTDPQFKKYDIELIS